jgi:hypothetical protein
MTILKRRVHPITFRVAAEEYDVLSSACVKSGARSVAEFARLAVLQKATNCTSSPGTLSGDLATVSMALGDVDSSLRDLSKKIRAVLGGVSVTLRE